MEVIMSEKRCVRGGDVMILPCSGGSNASQQQVFESGIKSFLSQKPEDLLKKSEYQEEDR